MFPPRPTELLHLLLKGEIREGDFVIDATSGNGHDTLFLAHAVGRTGAVLTVDIQSDALESTAARLRDAGCDSRVEYQLGCHSRLDEFAKERRPRAVIFNLGYLPGGDHDVTTQTESTLQAIQAAARILSPGGILAVICYPGHDSGAAEAQAVENFLPSLAGHRTACYKMIGTEKPAPFLLLSQKAASVS